MGVGASGSTPATGCAFQLASVRRRQFSRKGMKISTVDRFVAAALGGLFMVIVAANLGRAMSKTPAAPPATATGRFVMPLGNSQGDLRAPIGILEFSDFECPFCAAFARSTLPQLRDRYVKTSQVRLGFINFPMTTIHPLAASAARLSECSAEQGKFWAVHDRLFAAAPLTSLGLHQIAEDPALVPDRLRLRSCFDHRRPVVSESTMIGLANGVAGTPTFFLGLMDNGSLVVKLRLEGAQSFEAFAGAIEELKAEVTSSRR